MMSIEDVVNTMLHAAAFLKKPAEDLATQGLKDLYAAVKAKLKEKFAGKGDAMDALDKATEKPESAARKGLLMEEMQEAGLQVDPEIADLVRRLAAHLPATTSVQQNVSVRGRGNRVQVAGGNITNIAEHTTKNTITPDESHLSGEQKAKLTPLINELAARLAGEDGDPDYRRVHLLLQRRFDKTSYLLIKRTDFEAACAFLKEQRAIHRPRLRTRNPVAYSNDFYRGIYSRAGELGWDKSRVYQFAFEKLALKSPLSTLKSLGSNQLKALGEAMAAETRKHRASGEEPTPA